MPPLKRSVCMCISSHRYVMSYLLLIGTSREMQHLFEQMQDSEEEDEQEEVEEEEGKAEDEKEAQQQEIHEDEEDLDDDDGGGKAKESSQAQAQQELPFAPTKPKPTGQKRDAAKAELADVGTKVRILR